MGIDDFTGKGFTNALLNKFKSEKESNPPKIFSKEMENKLVFDNFLNSGDIEEKIKLFKEISDKIPKLGEMSNSFINLLKKGKPKEEPKDFVMEAFKKAYFQKKEENIKLAVIYQVAQIETEFQALVENRQGDFKEIHENNDSNLLNKNIRIIKNMITLRVTLSLEWLESTKWIDDLHTYMLSLLSLEDVLINNYVLSASEQFFEMLESYLEDCDQYDYKSDEDLQEFLKMDKELLTSLSRDNELLLRPEAINMLLSKIKSLFDARNHTTESSKK